MTLFHFDVYDKNKKQNEIAYKIHDNSNENNNYYE